MATFDSDLSFRSEDWSAYQHASTKSWAEDNQYKQEDIQAIDAFISLLEGCPSPQDTARRIVDIQSSRLS